MSDDIVTLLSGFQSYLAALDIPEKPEGLYGPVRYALTLGGKRMRPLLLMLSYRLYGKDIRQTYDAASGIEIFHNFTLLHDDVMDKADIRRGKPTVHVKWNENTAILSGDAMAFLACRYMERVPDKYRSKVMDTAYKAFFDVVEGQQYDMDFENRTDVTVDEYMEMIRLKTAVLPAASMMIGAVLGGASDADALTLYDAGQKMGLAFQLQDDWLDVYGDPKVFGKNVGGDILCNKKTYLYIMAGNLADEACRRELDTWAECRNCDPKEKIAAVTAVYDRLGVSERCREKIDKLFAEAMDMILSLDADKRQLSVLVGYVTEILNRQL